MRVVVINFNFHLYRKWPGVVEPVICTHIYDYSFAVVMVVNHWMEVVLAGVLRILMHARIFV